MRDLINLIESAHLPAPEQIAQTIRDTIQEWMASGRVTTVRQIGSGQCYEFCQDVLGKLGLPYGDYTYERNTEDYWADEFVFSISALRKAGEPVPKDIPPKVFASVIGGATHQWVFINNRHYDATAPEGREHFLEMPFFADQIAGLRNSLKSGARKKNKTTNETN